MYLWALDQWRPFRRSCGRRRVSRVTAIYSSSSLGTMQVLVQLLQKLPLPSAFIYLDYLCNYVTLKSELHPWLRLGLVYVRPG